jgi:hypothetical protein
MERGLFWLPLLALFVWLTWAGWNEYRKVEAYRMWAESFDRAKYDIRAVLGQVGDQLTWGMPHRNGPQQLKTFSLKLVKQIQLLVDGQVVDLNSPPARGQSIALRFIREGAGAIDIPFTEIELASRWGQALTRDLPDGA